MLKTVYVIIPIHNAGNYLKKCLDSVFNQTYKKIKVICINDGSNDDSLLILYEYKNKYSNLVVINQNNKGVSSARNAALNKLDYQEDSFITFIDADDWVDGDYIETLVKMMGEQSVDVVCSSFCFAREDYSKPYKHIDQAKILDNVEATRLLIRDETIQSHSYSSLFKIQLWEDIRYKPELFYMEDQDVVYQVFYKAKSIFVTNYIGYYYRQDNVNAVTKRSINNQKVLSGLKGYYYVCKYPFKTEDKIILIPAANNALAAAYLTLIPYYNKRKTTENEKKFLDELNIYIKNNKLVKRYIPNNRNNNVKKKLYVLCPPLYPVLFKFCRKMVIK